MAGEKLLYRLEQPHGAGDVYVTWQGGAGLYLATAGPDSMVNVFDRHGNVVERLRLPSVCASFAWDADGDLLGAVGQSQLVVWDACRSTKSTIDVGLKDQLTCLTWAKTGPVLAVGTAKGNVSIFDYNTSKRIPVIGKHSKRITCGAWNRDDLLALGSEDKTMSLSNAEGDTLKVVALRAEPSDLQFAEIKSDHRQGPRSGTENTISAVVGKRTLYLYKLLDPDNPFELAFQPHYGHIVSHKWYGDGYVLIGFSAGYFVAISTHVKEVGQELFQVRNHKNLLADVAICARVGKAASCGDNSVKIHDLANLQETCEVINLPMEAGVERVSWSADGQLLGVVTKGGSVNVYVSHMPQLVAACPPKIAVLSSLTEVGVYHYTAERDKSKPIFVNLPIEPTFIGVGQYHLAVGMNDRVWFYDLTKMGGEDAAPLADRQYLGAVRSVKLNPEYASVLFDGKIQLHMIEQPEVCHEDRESRLFPNENGDCRITCHDLTVDFLVYGTDTGRLVHFHVEEWSTAMEFQHEAGLGGVWADAAATRLVAVDVKGGAYVFDAVTSELVRIPDVPSKINGVTWDSNVSDRNVFILYDDNDIYTYLYRKRHFDGTAVVKIGTTVLVAKQTPLLMYEGDVMCATSGGQLSQLALSTHDASNSSAAILERDATTMETIFSKQLALNRFASAWKTCQALNSTECYVTLAEECLKNLDFDLAVQIYARLDDAAMAECAERMRDDPDEDWRALLGRVGVALGRHDDAQAWFLRANRTRVAMEMRRDLLQWDRALQLARKVAPDQVAMIAREYAQQLEFLGNYREALLHYEIALQDDLSAEHTRTCRAGIARTSLQCGNARHGIGIAAEMACDQLYQECAAILETQRQHNEAAILYEKCAQFDKAAACYATVKNWHKVGELMPRVTAPRLHLEYARAREAEGRYEEAARAYERARDHDALIRVHLERLNNPEIAVELVQQTKSVEGAKMVAKFFQNLNDTASAVKFLIMSGCADDAFELAKRAGQLETYADALLSAGADEEARARHFAALAHHFESEQRDSLLAGRYWFHGREYRKAMNHLLTAAKSSAREKEALTTAIDAAAASGDDALAQTLIDFLLGDADGTPKDPKFLFRLYMARKQYREASKSALIIANDEQINGFYRNAHDVLFAMCQELKQNRIAIPLEMYANLQLLHSYILVRMHVKRGDHVKGARLLIRVAGNISKFPAHAVPILTSAVIECHRAGLRRAAHKYATILMNPEYRKQIDPKYAKKIEAVVRKAPKSHANPDDGEDPPDDETSCPHCDKPLPATRLVCATCKNNLPFCIATGCHISKRGVTRCPNCDFPAIYDDFVDLLKTESACPMCSEPISVDRLHVVDDVTPYLTLT